jgi:hypothetical protein
MLRLVLPSNAEEIKVSLVQRFVEDGLFMFYVFMFSHPLTKSMGRDNCCDVERNNCTSFRALGQTLVNCTVI